MNRALKKRFAVFCSITCLLVAAALFPSNSFATIEFHLINAQNNKVLQPLNCYYYEFIYAREYGNNLNIRASLYDNYGNPANMSRVAKITFEIIGKNYNYTHTEASAPYAAYGDNNGNYNSWNISPGNYVIEAKAYDSGGNVLDTSASECFSFYAKENNYAWIDFHLINASNNNVMRELNLGHMLNRVPSNQAVTIRANIPNSNVRNNIRMVRFFVDGQRVIDEAQAPYAIAGDRNGNYNAWQVPSRGSHTIRAIGYNANNTPIAERTLRIEVN